MKNYLGSSVLQWGMMFAMANESLETRYNPDASVPYRKSNLTPKQKKARAKSKQAKKSRSKNRK
jgi:hypothetical protein